MINKDNAKMIAINSILWMMTGLYIPFLSSFLTLKGLSPGQVGIVIATFPLMSILTVPLWTRFSDRQDDKKITIYILGIAVPISCFLFYLFNSFISFLICGVVFSFFYTPLTPLLDSFLTSLCRRKNFDFSYVRLGGTLGFSVIVLLYGFVLNKYPNLQFVSIAFLSILLIFVIYHTKYKDISKSSLFSNKNEDVRSKSIFTSKKIMIVLIIAAISQFGVSLLGNFMGIFLIEQDISRTMIGIFSSISALSEVPILLSVNKFIHKFDLEQLLIFSCFTVVIRIFLFSTGFIPLMIVSQLLQSTSYMLVYYSATQFVVENVTAGKEGEGLGILYSTQSGYGTILSSLIGGALINYFGAQMTYAVVGTFIFIIIGMITLIQKNK